MPGKARPQFLSAAVMRRALQARLLSVHPHAQRLVRVRVQRLGGFEDRSFKLRYTLFLRLKSGQSKTIRLRGSSERQDQTRRQAYVIMKYLWRHGFDHGSWQIARPVTFYQRWRLLLYEEAAGVPLTKTLRRGYQLGLRSMDDAAEWLYQLHRHSPRTVPLVYSRIGRKQYWRNALALLVPERSQASAALRRNIHRVMAFEDRLSSARYRVLVHHDFHPANILRAASGLRVVDFTESRLSHPLVDVATFVTQLELLLAKTIPADHLAGWQERFLETYRRRTKVNYTSPLARRIFRFILYRIELQRQVAAQLFGNPAARRRELATVEW